MLSPEEKEILEYLHPLKDQFVTAKEVCRRAGGKVKFTKNPDWAKPILKRMEKKGLLEMNAYGHYRIKPANEQKKRQPTISPQIQRILAQSGKDFGTVYILEDVAAPSEPPQGSSADPKTKKSK